MKKLTKWEKKQFFKIFFSLALAIMFFVFFLINLQGDYAFLIERIFPNIPTAVYRFIYVFFMGLYSILAYRAYARTLDTLNMQIEVRDTYINNLKKEVKNNG